MVIQLQRLILIFVRITSFIVICPGFSYKGLSNIVKIAFAVGISVMVYFTTPEIEVVENTFYFFILTLKETALGLSAGFVTNLVFSTIQIAGQLIDFQVGFSMASVYDPMSETSNSNYGKTFYWMAISIFFILNLHHKVIESLIKSFESIPVTSVDFASLDVEGIVKLFGIVFEMALNIAAPIVIVVLVTELVLGVISKTVPQINVLILGMPLKSMVSFVIFLLMLSWFTETFGGVLSSISGYLDSFIQSLI